MLKKRLLVTMMAAVMCFSVTACSGNNNSQSGSQTTEAVQTEPATEATTAGYRDDVACADIEAAVIAAMGDDYWAAADMPGIADIGITEDMYTEYIFKAPMIMTNVDTLIVVKAAEGKVADVKAALEAYRQMKIEDTFAYPMNIPKHQNSVVAEYGNYVVFVQLGADYAMNASQELLDKNPNATEDEVAKVEAEAVIEQNNKALAAIESALK